jgi:large conductance mechanosensitive channel
MNILKEFKEFINRGSVVDLAVGVVIGAAFGKIVSSLVEDIIMPPIGRILGGLDFSNLYLPLTEKVAWGLPLAEARKLGPVLAWGNFVTIILNFIVVAFCIFMVMKAMNAMKRKEDAKPAEASKDPKDVVLLQEIRDLLKTQKS